LEAAAKADGEAEGKRKAMAARLPEVP
jgi:hypothetical protein